MFSFRVWTQARGALRKKGWEPLDYLTDIAWWALVRLQVASGAEHLINSDNTNVHKCG